MVLRRVGVRLESSGTSAVSLEMKKLDAIAGGEVSPAPKAALTWESNDLNVDRCNDGSGTNVVSALAPIWRETCDVNADVFATEGKNTVHLPFGLCAESHDSVSVLATLHV